MMAGLCFVIPKRESGSRPPLKKGKWGRFWWQDYKFCSGTNLTNDFFILSLPHSLTHFIVPSLSLFIVIEIPAFFEAKQLEVPGREGGLLLVFVARCLNHVSNATSISSRPRWDGNTFCRVQLSVTRVEINAFGGRSASLFPPDSDDGAWQMMMTMIVMEQRRKKNGFKKWWRGNRSRYGFGEKGILHTLVWFCKYANLLP